MRLAAKRVDHPEIEPVEQGGHVVGHRVEIGRIADRDPAGVEAQAGAGDLAVRLIDGAHRNAGQVDVIGQLVVGHHGGIAALSPRTRRRSAGGACRAPAAGHSRSPGGRGRGRAAEDRRYRGSDRHGRESRSPPRRRFTRASSSCSRRSGEVSTRIRQGPCSTRIEARRRRFLGSARSHCAPIVADPRHARGGAAAEEAQPHAAGLGEKSRGSWRRWRLPGSRAARP